MIVKQVFHMRGDVGKRANISGPDYFELTSPVICYLIQQMEGANYAMKQFKITPSTPAENENEGEEAPVLPIPKISRDENGKPIFPIP
jgi:hypothetical protein